MGLCKCPKKKVTNLFCFEHRVNVCEHCLVANHPQCIVQSYLQWLQDSDFNSACGLCNRGLSDEECGECVRLVCYDVFHWACLNQYAQQLPANTAPAGYTCPHCRTGLFPASNVVSPVAECLRQTLSKVNWARAGLGLPLIEEPEQPVVPAITSDRASPVSHPEEETTPIKAEASLTYSSSPPSSVHSPASSLSRPSAQVSPYTSTPTVPQVTPHSVINVDAGATSRGQEKHGHSHPRKLFDSTKGDDLLNVSHDPDEQKYKRRPALAWLAKWLKSREGQKQKDPNAMLKRFLVVLLIGLIGFITLVVIFSRAGRNAADHDPFLDPMANPNIRVNEKLVKLPD